MSNQIPEDEVEPLKPNFVLPAAMVVSALIVIVAIAFVIAPAAWKAVPFQWLGYEQSTTEKLTDPEKIVDQKQQILDLIIEYIQVSSAAASEGNKATPDPSVIEKAEARRTALLKQIKDLATKLRPEDITPGMRRFVDKR